MPQADDDTSKEVIDTSTEEDTVDTDDFGDFSFEDAEDDDTEQSEDSEQNEEVADTEQQETEEESEEDEGESEEEQSTEETQDTETIEEATPSKEEIKRRNDENARLRIEAKQAREQERARQQADYIKTAEDDQQLALRQLQVDAYNNKVMFNERDLQSGIDRAIANIDLFTKGSPEVKEELLRAVDDFEKLYVKYDQNGDPIKVDGDVYQYLNAKADSIRRLVDVGARQSTKDRNTAKTRTITPPSKTPKQAKVDPDLDAFDEEVAKGW